MICGDGGATITEFPCILTVLCGQVHIRISSHASTPEPTRRWDLVGNKGCMTFPMRIRYVRTENRGWKQKNLLFPPIIIHSFHDPRAGLLSNLLSFVRIFGIGLGLFGYIHALDKAWAGLQFLPPGLQVRELFNINPSPRCSIDPSKVRNVSYSSDVNSLQRIEPIVIRSPTRNPPFS